MSNIDLIMVSEIQGSLKKENTFEENIKIAMKLAKSHWLVTDPNQQFAGAVGALGVFYGQASDEFKRLQQEMKVLNSFSALGNNVPVDFNTLLDGLESDLEPCHLRKIWDEI